MIKNITTLVRRPILTLAGCCLITGLYAQFITGPDTVLAGSSVTFSVNSTDNKFISYAWEFNGSSLTPIAGNAVAIPNTGTSEERFSVAAAATMVYDDKTKAYYGFVSCASSGFSFPNIQRIDFGADPHNPNPGTTNLGNPANAFITNSGGYFNMQDIKIILNDDGIYHAFINNGGVVHWVFGNGLGQPPTFASRIFNDASVLGMSMNMAIIKYNNQWYLFSGQTFGSTPGLVRLDLGANLNNIPAAIPYHSFGSAGYSDLDYLAIIKQNGNWYIKMTSHTSSSTLFNFNFGTNLLNLNPVVTNNNIIPAGAPNRGLNFINTCDTTYMLGLGQDGNVFSFKYPNNNVSSTPNVTSQGAMFGFGVAMQQLSPYWYRDTLWALSASYANDPTHTVYRLPLAKAAPTALTVKYYDPAVSHTFQNTGVYDVQVYCDQGDNRGPQSFCKQVVVTDQINGILEFGAHKGSLLMFPSPATTELNITSPLSGKCTYAICNVLGQQLYCVKGRMLQQGEIITINLSGLDIAAGIYFVKLTNETNDVYSSRFIKK